MDGAGQAPPACAKWQRVPGSPWAAAPVLQSRSLVTAITMAPTAAAGPEVGLLSCDADTLCKGCRHTGMELMLMVPRQAPTGTDQGSAEGQLLCWEHWDPPWTYSIVGEDSIKGSHCQPLDFPLVSNSVPCLHR